MFVYICVFIVNGYILTNDMQVCMFALQGTEENNQWLSRGRKCNTTKIIYKTKLVFTRRILCIKTLGTIILDTRGSAALHAYFIMFSQFLDLKVHEQTSQRTYRHTYTTHDATHYSENRHFQQCKTLPGMCSMTRK